MIRSRVNLPALYAGKLTRLGIMTVGRPATASSLAVAPSPCPAKAPLAESPQWQAGFLSARPRRAGRLVARLRRAGLVAQLRRARLLARSRRAVSRYRALAVPRQSPPGQITPAAGGLLACLRRAGLVARLRRAVSRYPPCPAKAPWPNHPSGRRASCRPACGAGLVARLRRGACCPAAACGLVARPRRAVSRYRALAVPRQSPLAESPQRQAGFLSARPRRAGLVARPPRAGFLRSGGRATAAAT